MKKALLTVLIVLLTATAVFANYGLDFSGKFVSNSIKEKNGFSLSTDLKPYVSEGNYKVQLRFNWDANNGFTQFKIDNKNALSIASSIFNFVDNAYLQIGKSTLGIERNDSDLPVLYFRGTVGHFSYDIDTDLSFPLNTTLMGYTIPVEADINYVCSEEFPLTIGTDTTGFLLVTDEGIGYNVKPNLYFNVPVSINNHTFDVDYSFYTEIQKANVTIKPLETIGFSSAIGTTWGIYTTKDTVSVEKNSDGLVFAFAFSDELVLGDGTVSLAGYLPLTIKDSKLSGVFVEGSTMFTADYLSFNYDYQKDWFSFGIGAKVNSLLTAKAGGLKITDILNTNFVNANVYVAFDTVPFDLKLVIAPTSFSPFDASLSVIFNVNVENYLSEEN